VLSWKHKTLFEDLIKEMVDSDVGRKGGYLAPF